VASATAIMSVGAEPVIVDVDAGTLCIDAAAAEAAITPRTKALFLGYPCNPTGAVLSDAIQDQLADIARRHDLLVYSDEIYDRLAYGAYRHRAFSALPGMRERTILMGGFSKAYAMTGWRMGYAAAPRAAAEAMDLVQSHTTSNASSISQHAAIAALTGDGRDLAAMAEAFARRRRLVIDALARIEGIELVAPQGAFYVFPDVSRWLGGTLRDATALCERLLMEAGVAAVSGEAFGDPRCLRLSYATSDELLREGLARVARFLASLPVPGGVGA
jgi:aspartate/methionine/tyrosine aminotransferase